ncbi:hypothetical protein [Bacillus sp. T33-2]|uniref:hypothetical protein n=1 Tax=Bacillus sp. T33-2 TaxID=2054168 RepID=UPI000C772DAB|nr:hypothetical protein [Bacillus sp. T33-2]PLR97567.1 hypothetical protein CVD19_08790 [Bacillus sp. T33-2]
MAKINHSMHLDLLEQFSFGDEIDTYKIASDLVNVMYAIYQTELTSKNPSPRKRKIVVPVNDMFLWVSLKTGIEDLLNWIYGESFELKFEQCTTFLLPEPNLIPDSIYMKEAVTVFSESLDSLAGAFNNYSNGIISDYVAFVTNNEEAKAHADLKNVYQTSCPDSVIHIAKKKSLSKRVHHSAARPLVHLSLATAKALSNHSHQVFAHQNGMSVFNPEFGSQYSAKTILLYNRILKEIGVDVKISNSFAFLTLGEVLNNMDSRFKAEIKKTVTCHNISINPDKNNRAHCGICLSCLLRKISLAAYGLEKHDVIYHYDYGIKVSDILVDEHREKYNSNINHLLDYGKENQQGRIYVDYDMSEHDYEPNFQQKIKQMIHKFNGEFERFWAKYPAK